MISSREFPFVFSKIVRTNARAEVSPRDLMWKTKRALKLNKIHPLPEATLKN